MPHGRPPRPLHRYDERPRGVAPTWIRVLPSPALAAAGRNVSLGTMIGLAAISVPFLSAAAAAPIDADRLRAGTQAIGGGGLVARTDERWILKVSAEPAWEAAGPRSTKFDCREARRPG